MKILISIFFLTLICAKNDNLTNNNLQNILMSADWKLKNQDEVNMYVKYTLTERQYYFEGNLVSKESYYISSTNCYQSEFDLNKVGVETSGEYLSVKESCFFIEIISDDEIKFHHLDDDSPSPYSNYVKK